MLSIELSDRRSCQQLEIYILTNLTDVFFLYVKCNLKSSMKIWLPIKYHPSPIVLANSLQKFIRPMT